VVLAAQPLVAHTELTNGLESLQIRLMGHFFRLAAAERRLAAQARPRRRGGGRKAIRQMELERRRLGRELHTGAGQALAAIRIQLEVIANELPEPTQRVRQALERIGALAGNTLEQVRSISRRLHPPEWQRLNLVDALQQLWDLSGIEDRFDAELRIDPLPIDPDLEVKVLVYRAVQEGLSNLIRHARPTKVAASLECADGQLRLTVRDNGIGFDVERTVNGPVEVGSGIGLRSVREQAEALGGTMAIESGPSGTTLIVSVAISPAEG
jgi:two-component system sensor histidine kinase NreB